MFKNLTKEEKTYNGYTNRETWLIGLHIDNDEPLYRRFWWAFASHVARFPIKDTLTYKRGIAKWIREWCEVNLPTQNFCEDALEGRQTIGGFWRRVNWYEVASLYLDETKDMRLCTQLNRFYKQSPAQRVMDKEYLTAIREAWFDGML